MRGGPLSTPSLSTFWLLLTSLLRLVLELSLLSGYLGGALGLTRLGQAPCFSGVGKVILALLLLIHTTSL